MSPAALSVDRFSFLLKEALQLFYEDLAKTRPPDLRTSWYKREQEIVSLFSFRYLVPLLQREGVDPGVLRIEGRVRQHPTTGDGRERGRKDLVVWPDCLDTVWRPDVKHPLAVLEWKLSTSEITPKQILDGAETDLCWLKANADLMGAGYGILVEWPQRKLRIICRQVTNQRGSCIEEVLISFPRAIAATA